MNYNWKNFVNETVNKITLYHGTSFDKLSDILKQGIKTAKSHDILFPKIFFTPDIQLAARYAKVKWSSDDIPVIIEVQVSKNERIKKLKHDQNDEYEDAWYDEDAYLNSNEIIELHRFEKQFSDILGEMGISFTNFSIIPDNLEQLDGLNIFKLAKGLVPQNKFEELKNKLQNTILLRDYNFFTISQNGTIELNDQWYSSRKQLYQSEDMHFSTIKYFYVRENDFSKTDSELIVDRDVFGFKYTASEAREAFDKLREFLEYIISDNEDIFEIYNHDDALGTFDGIYDSFESLYDLVDDIWQSNNPDDLLRNNIQIFQYSYEQLMKLWGEDIIIEPNTVWLKIKNRYHMRPQSLKERYIIEGFSVLEQNKTFLENDSMEMPTARQRKLLLDVAENIKQVSPLISQKIVRRLGYGVFGIAYLLDTDRVIKFYYTEHVKTDAPMHSKMENALYSGQINTATLPVFDTKTIDIEENTGISQSFTYTVMPKFMILTDYYKLVTGNKQNIYEKKIWSYTNLVSIILNFFKYEGIEASSEDIYHHIKTYEKRSLIEAIVKYLGKQETEAIVEMMVAAANMYGNIDLDVLKPDNIGVVSNSIGTNNLTFIAFDV